MSDEPTPPPFAISTYKLVEQLDARGLLAAFDGFLSASLSFQMRFFTVQEIQSDHAEFSAAFAAFTSAANVSAEDAAAILEAARAGEIPVE